MVAPTTYAKRLRAALERSSLSKRQVGKLLAEQLGSDKPEDVRSALYRYLKDTDPTEPSPDRARILAEILDDPSLAEVTPAAEKRRNRREALEGEVSELKGACVALLRIVELLAGQVEEPGGQVLRDALEAAALAVLRTPGGAR